MDFETVSATDFGKSLRGVGINLLTGNVKQLADFLNKVFGVSVHRLSDDFAILVHGNTILQLHSDGTYGSHPLHSYLPENPPRGQGAQFFIFDCDPDLAVKKARSIDALVIEEPRDKPHGLREATILSPEGYAFTAASVLEDDG